MNKNEYYIKLWYSMTSGVYSGDTSIVQHTKISIL